MTVGRDIPDDSDIREAIIVLATSRGAEKTICPSEVARHAGGDEGAIWRPLMPSVRRVAFDLAAQGKIDIKKGGEIVDPETLKGIYRIAIKN